MNNEDIKIKEIETPSIMTKSSLRYIKFINSYK